MKKFLSNAVVALSIMLLSQSSSYAQSNMINCAGLHGTTLTCVRNTTGSYITAIQVTPDQMFTGNWMSIPGGSIVPGGTSIVPFNAWNKGCRLYVTIRQHDGRIHTYPAVDLCATTSFAATIW